MINNDPLNTAEPAGAQRRLRLRAWQASHAWQYALVGIIAGVLFPVVASFTKISELGLPLDLSSLIRVQLTEPLLWMIDTAPVFLGFVAGIAGRRQDLALRANQKLIERESELSSIRVNLEQGILERTRELDERNAQMRAVISFARQVAEIQDIAALLPASAAMIAERFERRDVNLFLLDEKGQWAVLMASSAAAGRNLLRDGFRIPVGDQSLVGRVAKRGKLLVSPKRTDGRDPASRPSSVTAPASDVGMPLVVRGKLIGVLEIQSQESRAISPSETELFQLLADQLAASIENARLVSESRTTVSQLVAITSESTRATWQQFLKRHELLYQFTPSGVKPVAAAADAKPSNGLKIPLTLRGEEIGSFVLQRKSGGNWSQTEQELLQRIAAQVVLALENARLLEETRQRASQERIVSEISARFSHSLDVDALLQTAVREFAALPEVIEAAVYLRASDESARQTRI